MSMLKYVTVEKNKRFKVDKSEETKEKSADSRGDQDMAAASADTEQLPRGFEFVEKKGDLFSCHDSKSMAHCISADVRMGKGIAVLFKRKFGGVQELLKQGQKPGGCAVLKRDKRYVYYLVTKEKYWNKPTYETLRSSVVAMREHCVEHGVTQVAMPRIGCGLDGLQWGKVADLIRDEFRDTNISLTVFTL